MKKMSFRFLLPVLAIVALAACNNEEVKTTAETKEPALKEESITYTGDSITMNGFVVYDENIEGARPAVLIVPEWWGLNDYAMMRARELAKLGYIALAMDMYGNGKVADNPDSAGAAAGPFYQNPQMAKTRMEAAIAKLKSYPQTDGTNIAAIGYCFGGAMVLNTARMGLDVKGVVSFHGNLVGTPLNKDLLKAKILVCHGAADPFVPAAEVATFKQQMDSTGITYTFKEYADAVHAFTNPNATAMGEKFKIPIKYNAAADTASWKDMKEFFTSLFQQQ
ncbi:dienelactone hydrolase family protein [Lacibacter sediminis]|uniref:Dienelactone hydrolase family protein n=1 Tax=Lacibacter sediminis TaxID=2760713 RepID=A0A7G5XE42_9BACT|nr:dienelactone hydrolase family protein [Lacibacter sediminis]QNA43745.1 dienelactone hydrolase family protein [Lacibacter sediminis]